MQRWIVLSAVAVVFVLSGGLYGYWDYKQNLSTPMWVPMPISLELPDDQRERIAKELMAKLIEPTVLLGVSRDLTLAKQWNLTSEAAAAEEVRKRLFVEVGEMAGPIGKIPSINIGIRGKKKEKELSGKIAVRLLEDVRNIIGPQPQPATAF